MYFLRIFTIGAKSLLKNSSWWLLPPVIQPEMLWIFSWNYDVITSRKRLCLLRNEFSMKCRWFIWNMISSKSAVRLYIFDWAPSLLGLRSIKITILVTSVTFSPIANGFIYKSVIVHRHFFWNIYMTRYPQSKFRVCSTYTMDNSWRGSFLLPPVFETPRTAQTE